MRFWPFLIKSTDFEDFGDFENEKIADLTISEISEKNLGFVQNPPMRSQIPEKIQKVRKK